MGRQFHQEIDSLRKSGACKEALDLARYAYSQMSGHRLIKRSYSWAIYSYLKLKCAQVNKALQKRELSDMDLLESKHPRVIEVNQLCREYRINKLETADLCFSLILRLLCRFSLPPLGMYGLIKWSKSLGLRDEDYRREKQENSRGSAEILLVLIASRLESLVIACDQIDPEHKVFERFEVVDLAKFAAALHAHAYEKCLDLSQKQRVDLAWTTCWLYRRSQSFTEGLNWSLKCFRANYSTPSLWWEVALCLAKDHQNNEVVQGLEKSTVSINMSSALACALHASIEAKKQGVDELQIVHLYAKVALWSYHLDYRLESRALLTIAIETIRKNKGKVPFKWVEILSELGGELADPTAKYQLFAKQASLDAKAWLDHQFGV